VTGIAPFVTDAAGAVLDSEISKLLRPRTTWLMRVTRPRLWFLAKANASASQVTQPTYRLRSSLSFQRYRKVPSASSHERTASSGPYKRPGCSCPSSGLLWRLGLTHHGSRPRAYSTALFTRIVGMF
jgi:hypothetical protein